MITQTFKLCNQDKLGTSKTLTIAKQSEVSFKKCFSVTCFSFMKTNSLVFMIAFAVAGIIYKILRTSFNEKYF